MEVSRQSAPVNMLSSAFHFLISQIQEQLSRPSTLPAKAEHRPQITTVAIATLLQKAGEGSLVYVGATVNPSRRLSAHRRRFEDMGEMLVTPVANMRQVEDQLLQSAATTQVKNKQHKSNARGRPGYVYGLTRSNANPDGCLIIILTICALVVGFLYCVACLVSFIVVRIKAKLQQRRGGVKLEPKAELEPTEGELEPTEGELEPTEGELERTEGELEPTEGELEPTEAELKPTEDELEPTEDELEPTQDELEPTEADLLTE